MPGVNADCAHQDHLLRMNISASNGHKFRAPSNCSTGEAKYILNASSHTCRETITDVSATTPNRGARLNAHPVDGRVVRFRLHLPKLFIVTTERRRRAARKAWWCTFIANLGLSPGIPHTGRRPFLYYPKQTAVSGCHLKMAAWFGEAPLGE